MYKCPCTQQKTETTIIGDTMCANQMFKSNKIVAYHTNFYEKTFE